MASAFQRYLLPGVVFMSVVVGGGYATGRELAQFILPLGPRGGLCGQAIAALLWSIVLAISFELVRKTQTYDYRSFIGVLLGRGWFLFEAAYLALLILALAVFGAAAGSLAADSAGLPPLSGTLGLMVLIGLLVFHGSGVIERVLSVFAVLLYVIYIVIVVWSFVVLGDRIEASFASATAETSWVSGGIIYAGYNTALIPAVLFCLRHQTTRREAVISGLLAGPMAMLPGVFLFLAMLGCYPEVGEQPVPVTFLLAQLGAPWFEKLFEIVLFAILVKCGTALLHSINERVANACGSRGMCLRRVHRSLISFAVLLFSFYAATAIGLVDLVAKGYGGLTFAFIVLLVIPVLTMGVWRILQPSGTQIGFESEAAPADPAAGAR
jgi:uncharacterized membrane protein YkvI